MLKERDRGIGAWPIGSASSEERLFPAVREAGEDVVIVAAGTSCRHQNLSGTGRAAQHSITILAEAIEDVM